MFRNKWNSTSRKTRRGYRRFARDLNRLEPLEFRRMLAGMMNFDFQVVNLADEPVSTVLVGEVFRVKATVQDGRAPALAQGVQQAVIDLGISNSGLISPASQVVFGSGFPFGQRAFQGSDLEFEFYDEITAAIGSIPAATTSPVQFFTIDFRADAEGLVTFNPNQPENSFDPPGENVLFPQQFVPNNEVMFGNPFTVSIVGLIANDDQVTTPEDSVLQLLGGSVDLTTNDFSLSPPLNVISISPIDGVTRGSVEGMDYVPPTDFVGIDRITYVVQDASRFSSLATVTINVVPVNDPPIAGTDFVSSDEDERLEITVADLLFNDLPGPATATDELSQVLSIVSVDTTTSAGGNLIFDGATVVYTPPADFVGVDSFVYNLLDSTTTLTTSGSLGTVTITVRAVNDAPQAVVDTVAVEEDETLTIPALELLSNDLPGPSTAIDEQSQGLAITGVSSTSTAGGSLNFAGGAIVYTPRSDFNGDDTFTYTLQDELQAVATGTVTVSVSAVNDSPIAAVDRVAGFEDESITIALADLLINDLPGPATATDEQNQLLSVISVDSESLGGGTVGLAGDAILYAPPPDFNGVDSFTYTLRDDLGGTASGIVTLSIAPINDAPIAGADFFSSDEDVRLELAVSELLNNDLPGLAADEQAQSLFITAVNATSSAGGGVSFSNDTVVFTPATDYFGSDSFTYTVQDSLGAFATGVVSLSISSVNDPPVTGPAAGDQFNGFENSTLTITAANLLVGDLPGPANESGQTLTIVSVQAGENTNGSVTLTGNSIVYEPTPGFVGTATFSYTVQDDGGGQSDFATGTAVVTVSNLFASLQGSVFEDESGDGVRQAGESGLVGRVVFLDADNNGVLSLGERQVETDQNGGFLFENVRAGSYRVVAAPDSRFAQTTDDLPELVLVAGENAIAGAIGNFRLTTLTGRIFGDRQANGVLDGDDDLKWHWPITLTDGNGTPVVGGLGQTITQPKFDGGYFFEGLLPNGVTIRTPGGGSISAPGEYVLRSTILPGYELTTQLDGLFSDGQFIATGSITGHVATGDVNQDGLLDIVVANDYASQESATSSISVLINRLDAPGTFQVETIPLPDHARPQRVRLVDVEEDGFIDILVALQGTPIPGAVNEHGIFMIHNHAGTFAISDAGYLINSRAPDPSPEMIQMHLDEGKEPRFVSSLDVPRSDGPSDFVVYRPRPGMPLSVVVTNLRSDNILFDDLGGNQSFMQIGLNPTAVESGDLDADGIDDLVFAHFDGFIDYMLSSSGQLVDVPVGADGPTDLALVDVDRDGDLDILTNNLSAGSVIILELEHGKFVGKQELFDPKGEGVTRIAFANVNGCVALAKECDADVNLGDATLYPDIIATNEGTDSVTVWINQQGTGFKPSPLQFSVALPSPNPFGLGVDYPVSPQQVVAGDFNADGLNDYIVGNRLGGVSLHLNNGAVLKIDDLSVEDPRQFDFGFAATAIVGQKWVDTNQNARVDAGEPGLPGTTIYADLNGNQRLDADEPQSVTDDNGYYAIEYPQATGSFAVREVPTTRAIQTFPGGAAQFQHAIVLSGNPQTDSMASGGLNFGNFPSAENATLPTLEGESRSNPLNVYDVNNDLFVSPLDALVLVNALNRRQALVKEGEGESTGRFYTDVSGDGVLSPLDVLLVINYLNSAEGEASGEAGAFVDNELTPALVDAAYFDWDTQKKRRDG